MRYSYLYGAAGSPVNYNLDTYKDKTRFVLTAFFAIVAVFGIVGSQLINTRSTTVNALPEPVSQTVVSSDEASTQPEPAAPTVSNQTKPANNTIDLSAWLLSHKGTYSVSVYDSAGKPLTEVNANDPYFMASIYKLYVAYVGYQNLDDGIWIDDENYWNDWSRTKCLDEMIRSSHSPCGEKMMAEIGKTNVQSRLNEYGLENTSFKQFKTSSADVANVLIRLQKGLDLSELSKQKFMDSMAGQIYRDGMPKGFGDWSVSDKVGFRDQDEYHDVGIVTSPTGQAYVVSMFTRNAGSEKVADLAATIKSSIH